MIPVGTAPESQRVPFGPYQSAPFDDYSETHREEFLGKLPLVILNLLAQRFIPDFQRKSIHPSGQRRTARSPA
jgi:hypothetical protein